MCTDWQGGEVAANAHVLNSNDAIAFTRQDDSASAAARAAAAAEGG